MKNTLLVPVIAALLLFVVGFASADELAKSNSIETEFNGVWLNGYTQISGDVGSTVPIRVVFEAAQSMEDVRVKVEIEGHRDEVSAQTARFDTIQDLTYTKLLSLDLPSDDDETSQEYTLYVEIVSANDKSEATYTIHMQRTSHTLEILSVDYDTQVTAGSTVPISVVAKNTGFNREDDNYLVASISALGISARTYIGDLIPVEDEDLDEEEDSRYDKVSLKIPSNVQEGVYDLEIMVYNDDAKTMVKKKINIVKSAEAQFIPTSSSKDISAGETVTYDLVVVNTDSSVKVFNLEVISGDALIVSAPSVFVVGPESSQTIPITVKAADSTDAGIYTFSVTVNGESHVFQANVTGSNGSTSTSVVALTVVLVIIFVVLLAVLVVLLTRREKPIEDVETSYY